MNARRTILVFSLVVLGSVLSQRADALHDSYRFKWPYKPGASATITTTAAAFGSNDPWFDIDGGGATAIPDIALVAAYFGAQCTATAL